MSDELEQSAREFVTHALREEGRANPAELARIRTRVLTSALAVTSVGGAAHAAGVTGKGWLAVVSTPVAKTLLVGSLAVGGVASLAATLPEGSRGSVPASSTRAKATSAPAAEGARGATTSEPFVIPPAPVPEREVVPMVEAPAPAQRERRTVAAAAVGTSAERMRPALSEELAVLQRAQARLNAGDGKAALRLLDETAAAQEDGQLSVERRAVEILAACQAGQHQRADRLARKFLAEHPDVPAAARVRGSCAGQGR